MKRALVLILAIVLVVAATATVYAIDSATAQGPVRENGYGCRLVPWPERDTLSPIKKQIFEDSKDCLEAAVPEGYSCRDLYYHEIGDGCDLCVHFLRTDEENPVNEDLDMKYSSKSCAMFRVDLTYDGIHDVIIKHYVHVEGTPEGTREWVQIDANLKANLLTIIDVADAPVAIFVK